ncbi:hypothetical protein GC173_13045 [bacterium]|nr:hypothetical protein [bacterium]
MKRFALIAAATLLVGSASAQTVIGNLWYNPTGANRVVNGADSGVLSPDVNLNDNNTRSGGLIVGSTEASDLAAFVVKRGSFDTVNNAVRILDASNGSYLRSLDNTGISGGVFPMNAGVAAKVGASSDASIFLGNLINSTGTSGAGLKLYLYPTDAGSVAPTQIANDALSITSRCGDTISAVGSGTNVTIYLAGNNAAARVVAVSTTDGGGSWTTAEVGPTRGALGIAGDVVGGSIFMKSASQDIVEYDQAGTVVNSTFSGLTDTRTGLAYAEIAGAQLLAAASYANGTSYVNNVYDITNRAAVTTAYTTVQIATPTFPVAVPTNTNTNATSAISIAEVAGKITVFSVASNNLVALYQEGGASVSDWQLMMD